MTDRRKFNALNEIEKLAQNDTFKRLLKEAINEWLDEQFLRLGKWSFYGFVAAAVAALAWVIVTANGWHK